MPLITYLTQPLLAAIEISKSADSPGSIVLTSVIALGLADALNYFFNKKKNNDVDVLQKQRIINSVFVLPTKEKFIKVIDELTCCMCSVIVLNFESDLNHL